MGHPTCLSSLYLDSMREICLYLQPKDIWTLFGCGDVLLSQRLSENGCVRSIRLESMLSAIERSFHRLITCLPHLKSLELVLISDTPSLLRTISETRSSPLEELKLIDCQFEDCYMPPLSQLYPKLKTFIFDEAYSDSGPSKDSAAIHLFQSLPISLEVLDCSQKMPTFFIESQGPPNLKKLIVSSTVVESALTRLSQTSQTPLSDLIDAIFAHCPLLEVLGLPELKISETISKKVFPSSIARLIVTETKGATRPFFDIFEAPNVISLRYSLQKAQRNIIFPPTLTSLHINSVGAVVISLDLLTSFPSTLTKLKLRLSNFSGGDCSRFFSRLPVSLKYLEVSAGIIDYSLLPPRLETLIANDNARIVQPRPGNRARRHQGRNVTIDRGDYSLGNDAQFPKSLTELNLLGSALPISLMTRLPPLLRKLKVKIGGVWHVEQVLEMANRLPVCYISVVGPVSVEVGSSTPILGNKFNLSQYLDMIIPPKIRPRVQIATWQANFSSKLPEALTHVNVDQHVAFKRHSVSAENYALNVAEILPALENLNNLVFLKISVNDGNSLELDSLGCFCPSLSHLELFTSSPLSFFSPKNLPCALATFRSNFIDPDVVEHLNEFPSSITDLKLLGESVGFKPSSLEAWPTSLKRLEFVSSQWSDVDIAKLRDRLIHVQKAVVWGSVILTGQLLSSAMQISQIYDMNMKTLPIVMNSVLAPFRVLEYDFQPNLDNLREAGVQYILPDEITSLELSDPRMNIASWEEILGDDQLQLTPYITESAEVVPFLTISSFVVLHKVLPTSLTTLRLSLSIKNLIDTLDLPPHLTDLTLTILPNSSTTKPFARFPETLTRVSIQRPRQQLENIIVCEPGHLASLPSQLRLLDVPSIALSPWDIPDLPKALNSLHFFGGPIWDEDNIQELLSVLPNLRSLRLQQASTIGSLVPTDVPEIGPQDLIQYVNKSLKRLFPNVEIDIVYWEHFKPLRLPTGLKRLNLVDPAAKFDRFHSGSRESLIDFGIISPFLGLASNLVELSFLLKGPIYSMVLGSALPRQLVRLTAVADSFIPSVLHWSAFPRTLKSIRMFQPLNSLIDEPVGFPPYLEELIVPQHNFTSAVINTFPSSLTLLDVAEIAGAYSFMLEKLPWAPGSRHEPRQKNI